MFSARGVKVCLFSRYLAPKFRLSYLVDVGNVEGIAKANVFIASHFEEANVYTEIVHHLMINLNEDVGCFFCQSVDIL